MAVTYTESFTNPRDSLPNAYSGALGANAVKAREIDFVSRFSNNWDALREIIGIARPVRKTPGTVLKRYIASVDLEDGDPTAVPAGAVIPYSKATVEQIGFSDVTLQKYAKAVPIEDVNNYGAEVAIQRTDEAFLYELQEKVMGEFYTALNDDTYAETGTYTTFQMAVAMAIGKVRNKFKTLHKTITDVVVFANTLDAYEYLGAAGISTQNQFGIEYVQNFLGAKTLILAGANEVPLGTVIALPVENLTLYYVDPGDGQFQQLGLEYTVQGETNLIGFHANGNYSTAVGESFALLGLTLWYEQADGVAIVEIDPDYEPEGDTGETGETGETGDT